MLEFLESMKKSVLERPDGGLTLGRRHWLWSEVFRQYPADARVRQAVLGHVVCRETRLRIGKAYRFFEPTDNRLYYDFHRTLCRSVLLGELGGDAVRKQFTRLDGHAHLLGSVLMSQGEWNGVFGWRIVCRACADAIRPDPLPTPINVELTDAELIPTTLIRISSPPVSPPRVAPTPGNLPPILGSAPGILDQLA